LDRTGVLVAVQVAARRLRRCSWGIVSRAEGEPITALLNRILPMLWKLTRG
jgi:hypothetical protein